MGSSLAASAAAVFTNGGKPKSHEADDAAAAAKAASDKLIQDQKDQQMNAQNAVANNTAAAQARVRVLSNPDSSGATIMTPFRGNITPSPGSLSTTTGKQTLGS